MPNSQAAKYGHLYKTYKDGRRPITYCDYLGIYELARNGVTAKEIGAHLGVSITRVYQIVVPMLWTGALTRRSPCQYVACDKRAIKTLVRLREQRGAKWVWNKAKTNPPGSGAEA